MTLYQSGKVSVTDLPQKIRKVLEERESSGMLIRKIYL